MTEAGVQKETGMRAGSREAGVTGFKANLKLSATYSCEVRERVCEHVGCKTLLCKQSKHRGRRMVYL